MQEANPHLTPEQARHLTVHGVNQNEDGTYSWKFDNYVRARGRPTTCHAEDLQELWGAHHLPDLLVNGKESWASNPAGGRPPKYFKNAASSSSRAPGTGCTTTASTSSWPWHGGFYRADGVKLRVRPLAARDQEHRSSGRGV